MANSENVVSIDTWARIRARGLRQTLIGKKQRFLFVLTMTADAARSTAIATTVATAATTLLATLLLGKYEPDPRGGKNWLQTVADNSLFFGALVVMVDDRANPRQAALDDRLELLVFVSKVLDAFSGLRLQVATFDRIGDGDWLDEREELVSSSQTAGSGSRPDYVYGPYSVNQLRPKVRALSTAVEQLGQFLGQKMGNSRDVLRALWPLLHKIEALAVEVLLDDKVTFAYCMRVILPDFQLVATAIQEIRPERDVGEMQARAVAYAEAYEGYL